MLVEILTVAEAILCGTPVIAMPELIQQEKTGFLVKDIQEAVAAVQQIKRIECSWGREWSIWQFSQEKMAADYLRLYGPILMDPGRIS